ncbi:MAG: hypothetical protein Ct9H90mP27_0490 [Gammaproteobacteria bacterium]|nr:MAG: hypothetical protein Ct9H90mP27_0490 [Gammaproteobacteria bacterium]
MIVPRGGKDLIQRVSSETKINVIKHLDGVCHVYVDDPGLIWEKAVSGFFNSKSGKKGVCNAMETLLVHRTLPEISFLHRASFVEKGVELRCCPQGHSICSSSLLAEDSDGLRNILVRCCL